MYVLKRLSVGHCLLVICAETGKNRRVCYVDDNLEQVI